jgi:hypothetical protein
MQTGGVIRETEAISNHPTKIAAFPRTTQPSENFSPPATNRRPVRRSLNGSNITAVRNCNSMSAGTGIRNARAALAITSAA